MMKKGYHIFCSMLHSIGVRKDYFLVFSHNFARHGSYLQLCLSAGGKRVRIRVIIRTLRVNLVEECDIFYLIIIYEHYFCFRKNQQQISSFEYHQVLFENRLVIFLQALFRVHLFHFFLQHLIFSYFLTQENVSDFE